MTVMEILECSADAWIAGLRTGDPPLGRELPELVSYVL